MTELTQGFGFNLTDSFTGDVKFLAHFFKGACSAVFQTETEFQYLLFSGGELLS